MAFLTDKFQSPTPSENTLKTSIIRSLNSMSISCNFSHQEFLVVKVSTIKKYLNQNPAYCSQTIVDVLRRLTKNKKKYIVLRPDFYCSKYGFIIEVDGPVHDNRFDRIRRDELKDIAFKSIKLAPFRIDNQQVHDSHKRKLFIEDIQLWIRNTDMDPKLAAKRQAHRTYISKTRKSFKKDEPKHAYLIGSYSRSGARTTRYPTFPNEIEIQFSGYCNKIRPIKK
jgi:very-short-patch-repair endonuclease